LAAAGFRIPRRVIGGNGIGHGGSRWKSGHEEIGFSTNAQRLIGREAAMTPAVPILHRSLTMSAHALSAVPRGFHLRNLAAAVEAIDPLVVTGKVAGVNGLLIESRGGLSR